MAKLSLTLAFDDYDRVRGLLADKYSLATRAPTLEKLFPLRPDIQFKK